jgi:hypothetical protein
MSLLFFFGIRNDFITESSILDIDLIEVTTIFAYECTALSVDWQSTAVPYDIPRTPDRNINYEARERHNIVVYVRIEPPGT